MSSIYRGLLAGRSALQAFSTGLGVVADNVANAFTPGFKPSRVSFSEVLAGEGSLGGSGVSATTQRIDAPASREMTGRGLDAALEGNGMFVVENPATGERFYQRAGQFNLASDGSIRTRSGYSVLGYAPGGGGLQPLQTAGAVGGPTATTSVDISGNLDVRSAVVAAADLPVAGTSTFAQYRSTAESSISFETTDSLGGTHSATAYFYHTANTPTQQFEYRVVVDGADVGATSGMPVEVAAGQLQFTPTGARALPVPASDAVLSLPYANGSQARTVAVSFAGFTALATDSATSSIIGDGRGSAQVTGIEVGENGILYGRLSNGESKVLGQAALAQFPNAEQLTRIGNGLYAVNEASGAPAYGVAGVGGFGTVTPAALELSAVDIAGEFLSATLYQRGFEANIRMLAGIDDLLREITKL
ncbi:MAG: flagellar hook-basal body complex protein [Bdellovibrionales bacterium]|nr:flagellar hook-basal body complex protein [Bdellovibrionales bacterium]